MVVYRWCVLFACVSAASIGGAAEEEAVQVFNRVKGCVVGIESVANNGTGILIDAKGLVLTNAHVVAAPLRYKCLVDVAVNGDEETKVFQKVKVVSVHPTADLALIQIDPTEHKAKLSVATLAKEQAQTGQRVYAIGNPGVGGSVKLTKTITAGLLSGVGRQIEGVPYYQFDAAINAGNSGGPLCDREGKVIGLVTLKFTGAENVGFALPLDHVQLNEFKPFAQRPIDPKKSGKLIEVANKMSAEYGKLEKAKQQKSGAAALYRALALQFYLEALVENPKNPTIYGAIGVMLQKFGDYPAAEEFFLQALEIAPWGRSTEYRSFALLKALDKKVDEAEMINREGVAKYPVDGAQMWEDLAILYRDKADFQHCAWCAAMVLRLNNPKTRMQFADAVIKLCRSKVSDPKERAEMERMIAGSGRDLRNMVRVRNEKLKAHEVALTPEFATYLTKHGRTLDATGINDKALERVPAPFNAKNVVDLLAQLGTLPQSVAGNWTIDAGALKSPDTSAARMPAPVALPPQYDLTLDVTRLSGEKEFAVGFVRGGKQSLLLIDVAGTKTGVAGVKEGLYTKPVLAKDKTVEIVLNVRNKDFKVFADGEPVYNSSSADALPGPSEKWSIGEPPRIYFGSNESQFVIQGAWLVSVK